eukprot:COSAG03_NODE_155_length_11433_cov_30.588759_11_plen_97_part_00
MQFLGRGNTDMLDAIIADCVYVLCIIGGTLNDTAVRLIWVSTLAFEDAVEGAAKCRAYFSAKIGGSGFGVDDPVVLKAPSTLTTLDDAVRKQSLLG